MQQSSLSLIYVQTESKLVSYSKPPRIITIGRHDSNDVRLTDKGVSKLHCRLIWGGEKCMIEDLSSTNGVVVIRGNDCSRVLLRSNSLELRNCDSIQLGEASLRIEIVINREDLTEFVSPPVFDETEIVNPVLSDTLPKPENPMRALKTYRPSAPKREAICDAGESEPNDDPLETRLMSEHPFRFGRYQVWKKIGEGGMGAVYSAFDKDQCMVAIKFLKSQKQTPQDLLRFEREIDIAKQLKHPGIVECLDSGQEDGIPYIVMPFCSGGNLAELLKRSGTVQLRRALRLLDRLLAGMEYAHQLGIVHRDIKPCNILLGKDSNGKYRPMISDFGLAKFYQLAGDSGMTANGTVGGSWPYMPKEQLTNFRFVTPQSDVWSMGAILYECLTGQLPRGPTPKKDPFLAVLNAEVIPIAQVLGIGFPAQISRFTMKSLAVNPEDRFSDGGEMRAALHAVAKAEGIEL